MIHAPVVSTELCSPGLWWAKREPKSINTETHPKLHQPPKPQEKGTFYITLQKEGRTHTTEAGFKQNQSTDIWDDITGISRITKLWGWLCTTLHLPAPLQSAADGHGCTPHKLPLFTRHHPPTLSPLPLYCWFRWGSTVKSLPGSRRVLLSLRGAREAPDHVRDSRELLWHPPVQRNSVLVLTW